MLNVIRSIDYKSAREHAAHKLTGAVCGQCKCSDHLGWSKPEMQPNCECYQLAGELEEIFCPNHAGIMPGFNASYTNG